MDDLDRRLLAMVAAHELVTASQVRLHLKLDVGETERRISRLCDLDSLRREQLALSAESLVRVTRTGLVEINSRLPAPGFSLTNVRHQWAVVWLWVGAWMGGSVSPVGCCPGGS